MVTVPIIIDIEKYIILKKRIVAVQAVTPTAKLSIVPTHSNIIPTEHDTFVDSH